MPHQKVGQEEPFGWNWGELGSEVDDIAFFPVYRARLVDITVTVLILGNSLGGGLLDLNGTGGGSRRNALDGTHCILLMRKKGIRALPE